MTDMRNKALFLDNKPFAYDKGNGVFVSMSALSEERLTLEEVRRRDMVVSLYEVISVAGVPYVYLEHRNRFYRLGNAAQQMSSTAFEQHGRSGTKIAYLHGENFRAAVAKELKEQSRGREEDRGRSELCARCMQQARGKNREGLGSGRTKATPWKTPQRTSH